MNSGTSFSSETTVFHGGAQCPDISLAPSTTPEVVTCKDNENKFQFDLTTDAYDHGTLWILSNTNDGRIIKHGGNYQSDRSYIVTLCLPCGLYNFTTIYDSYGDGILLQVVIASKSTVPSLRNSQKVLFQSMKQLFSMEVHNVIKNVKIRTSR
mmetsp:Transcript_2001/g.3630  ORF Transcript_2001/g.3630 Transcript_2001/m.3630 type:complete len:153 (+) Transcript_2001:202-660(+)